MPEARYRNEKPVDYSAIFINRRSHGVLLDEPSLFQSPVPRLPSANPESGSIGRGSIVATGNFSSWRPGTGTGNGRGQSLFRLSQGRENMPIGSARFSQARDCASRSVLPSWYPRTPLRDITHIFRAIERRRGEGGKGVRGDGQEIEILEENCSMVTTPAPSVGYKRSFPLSSAKVHKMLLDITKKISKEEEKEEAEAGFVTPEKKLLNSLERVEKIVMKEIQKLKCTPIAKREEREKRVKTLMSMR